MAVSCWLVRAIWDCGTIGIYALNAMLFHRTRAHMASRRNRPINLPAPYLKRIWLEPSRVPQREAYPFCLPLLRDDFELSFDKAITIIVGENGTGKSTLLEGIAVLAGDDKAGGGEGE